MDKTRILVVDDDAVDRQAIHRLIAKAGAEYSIQEVATVNEAETALEHGEFDCALVDYRLPDGDGLQLIRSTIESGRPNPALILLTGHDDESLGMTALREGAQDYLIKGKIDPQVLTRSIRYAVERQRTEKIYKDQSLLLETILKQAADGMIVCDADLRITFANDAARTLTGMELLGVQIDSSTRPWGDLRTEDGRILPFEEWPLVRAVEGRAALGQVLLVERPDGHPLHLVVSAVPLVDSQRKIIGGVLSFANVTRQKETEFRKRELEEQLLQSRKMEAVGRLAGGVAHDFNNLLTVISGYASLLEKALTEEGDAREFVGEILKAASSATLLTRQLLAFSRKQVLQPRVLDINEVVASTQTLIKRLIRDNIETKAILSRDPCPVKLDPGQIQQVIMNLAVNAQDAMPDGGALTIETTCEDCASSDRNTGQCILTVTDTGTGMDGETARHIFEPFFTTKGQGKGTGLGLASVYGIVKQSNGEIRVDSEPGKGTRFTISFPRSAAPVWKEKKRDSEPCLTCAVKRDERILVVEDSPTVLSLVLRVLQTSGFEVIMAEDGRKGLEVARRADRVDLVISDVVMPHMGGEELIREVKHIHPKARILYMSGYAEQAIVRQGVLEPGSMFLEKPFTPTQLTRKVQEILAGPQV